jgi:tetratricopeptide (TPR) repeat protein
VAEAELAHPEPHYLRHACRVVRSRIRFARGDTQTAVEDAEVALDEARAIQDPQVLVPCIGYYVLRLAIAGDTDGAREKLGDLFELVSEHRPAGFWVVDVALAVAELEREAERIEEAVRLSEASPWRDAALAILRRDLSAAADILSSVRAASFEADVRLQSALALTAAGRHVEAAAQVDRALAFYRPVGATAAIKEAEALLAAAS